MAEQSSTSTGKARSSSDDILEDESMCGGSQGYVEFCWVVTLMSIDLTPAAIICVSIPGKQPTV